MQVHLVAVGTHGDVLPILALARALQRRGHDAALAAPAPFAAAALRAGVPFEPLGTAADYERFVADPELWRPWRGANAVLGYAARLAEQTFAWLQTGWRPGEGVVAASPLSVGARVAQDYLGLPLATLHVMPFLIESRLAPPVLPGIPGFLPPRLRAWLNRGADVAFMNPAMLPEVNAFRARLGLDDFKRIRHAWNSPGRVITMFPEWYAPSQADWPAQTVQTAFPMADRFGDVDQLDPRLADFLRSGLPPLAFTYGSAMRRGRRFFETAVSLSQRLGQRAVLVAPQAGQVPEHLPPDMIYAPYAPFSALLPHCAALVHHGGVGTVAQALAAGIPQLVVPVAFDHFDEGARLKRLGVGDSLNRRLFRPDRAAARLQALIGSQAVASACATIKNRMKAEDGVAATCDAIEAMMPAHA